MITAHEAEAFWSVVAECLVRFHHKHPVIAAADVETFNARLERAPAGVRADMVFHAEPFDVACTIAGNPLLVEDVRYDYERMVRSAFSAGAEPSVVRERRPRYGRER